MNQSELEQEIDDGIKEVDETEGMIEINSNKDESAGDVESIDSLCNDKDEEKVKTEKTIEEIAAKRYQNLLLISRLELSKENEKEMHKEKTLEEMLKGIRLKLTVAETKNEALKRAKQETDKIEKRSKGEEK